MTENLTAPAEELPEVLAEEAEDLGGFLWGVAIGTGVTVLLLLAT